MLLGFVLALCHLDPPFAKILQRRIKHIHRVKNLQHKEVIKGKTVYEPVSGLNFGDTIHLEHEQDDNEMLKTLIHELAHSLIADPEVEINESTEEYDDDIAIQKIEKILWRSFTKKQKDFLRRFIPAPDDLTSFPNNAP